MEVNPGDSGAVSFSFLSLSLFLCFVGGIISLPSINIDVFITGQQAQNGVVTELNNSRV